MAFNKAREEQKWKLWKENEENTLRTLGMEEKSIQQLRDRDWNNFKSERRYQEHRASFPEKLDLENPVINEKEIDDISALLDSISDERSFHIRLNIDK